MRARENDEYGSGEREKQTHVKALKKYERDGI